MPNEVGFVYLIAGFGSLLLSLLMTPLVRGLSRRWGFVDKPDGRRKTHASAVALGGGAAVFASALLALILTVIYATASGTGLFDSGLTWLRGSLLVASVLIVALGLVDDLIGMRGRTKLFGQIFIAGLLVYGGFSIDQIGFGGYVVPLGWLAIPATIFWLVGTTNAVNLIDGIDGLAGSVGFILCLTMAAITGWQGFYGNSIVMIALAGGLLGFLRYNVAPASIYLGDTGSMLVGLLVGAVATTSSAKSSAAMALAVPLAVWSIPILDTVAALVRRKLTGRSLFAPDRGHLHHSLLVRGWSVQQASMFIALICATTCLSAVMALFMENELIAILTVVGVMVFLVFTKTFGHIEFNLLSARFRRIASKVGRGRPEAESQEACIQLQGSREWHKLWQAIVESADRYQLTTVKLTINIHSLHECFYATWETARQFSAEKEDFWRLAHPLVIDGEPIGKIELTGLAEQENASTISQIMQTLEFIEPIEEDLAEIREKVAAEGASLKISRSNFEKHEIPPAPQGTSSTITAASTPST